MILLFHGSRSFARLDVSNARVLEKYTYRTSQCLRTAERHPATDLRGVKTSDDSFKTSKASPAEACRVDFQFGLFSYAAVGSTV